MRPLQSSTIFRKPATVYGKSTCKNPPSDHHRSKINTRTSLHATPLLPLPLSPHQYSRRLILVQTHKKPCDSPPWKKLGRRNHRSCWWASMGLWRGLWRITEIWGNRCPPIWRCDAWGGRNRPPMHHLRHGAAIPVAEPPELFQLKCLSHASGAVTHLNRNNPSVPQI
jgi:hypothetical protein